MKTLLLADMGTSSALIDMLAFFEQCRPFPEADAGDHGAVGPAGRRWLARYGSILGRKAK
jgi:hypothetical protein